MKWNLCVKLCSSHHEDPWRCSIRAVLSFLQQGLERRLSPSTLKVYVAAISTLHDPIKGRSVGKHDLVVRFLRGARSLNPPRPPSLPSWDLALDLRALQTAPFEPLQSVGLKFISMKTLLLTALASIRGWGTCRHFWLCLDFGPADSSTEAPAWLCAQGSYHSLRGPGSETASAAPEGGRPSPSFALSCMRTATRVGNRKSILIPESDT